MSFADLGLSEPLLRAVTDSGYDIPTPIQKGAIPPVLMGKDLIGIAQTGTGKTASFVLPMIDILSEGRSRARMPRSLILEPTRELAAQVAENFEKYGKYHKLSMALLIGGVQMGDQVKALEKGVDVLIATPGRLMDLFGRGKIMLNGCDLLVIDEADRMLDMGFIPDIEEICSKLPKSRQTLLFSATMPPPIQKLAAKFLTDPKTVEVARPATANVNIDQRLVTVANAAKKRDALRHILREDGFRNAIVFSNKKVTVRDLYTSLKRSGFSVGQIQGDMDQGSRIAEFDRFKKDEITILVASDVAARGLDVKGVSHVINFDVPWQPDDYIHRIGRTGRAGMKGIAYTLATARGCRGDRRDREIDRLQDQPRRQRRRQRRPVGRSRARRRGRDRRPRPREERAPARAWPLTRQAARRAPPRKPPAGRRSAARCRARAAARTPQHGPSAKRLRPSRAAFRRPDPTPAPVAAVKPADDADETWNGPVPSFLSLSAL